jgi:hypothetical protein
MGKFRAEQGHFFMNHFLCTAAAAGLSALAMSPSAAGTVDLRFDGSPNAVMGTVVVNGLDRQVGAGVIPVTEVDPDPVREFTAWCIDVMTDILPTGSYTEQSDRPGFLTEEQEGLINRLFTGFIRETNSDNGAAAFQLAMWEIIEEDQNSFSLTDPGQNGDDSFYVKQGSNLNSAVSTANDWLGRLDDIVPNYQLTYFIAHTDGSGAPLSQNLITATPIPLPAGIWLLGAGIGGLALARRRGSRKASA